MHRRTNPVPPSSKAQLSAALRRYEEFTGHRGDSYQEITVDLPRAALTVGECDGILYTTVRDGEKEHYIHRFKKSARPLLAASHNGKQLLLIGGNFEFTERGIVDN